MKQNIIGSLNGYDLLLILVLAVFFGFAMRDFLSMFFDPKRPKERGKESDILPSARAALPPLSGQWFRTPGNSPSPMSPGRRCLSCAGQGPTGYFVPSS